MNLTWLQTFILIVEKKSLTKAARALHLTQPAVSKQLNSLERFYGTPLLNRTSRHMEVTEAGKIVYEYSQQILAKINESLADVQALEKDLHGNLVLGASTIPGEYILPAALGRFQTLHPQVKVKLEIADSTEIGQMILDGKIEAGMIGITLENPVLRQEYLFKDELVVIAPRQHPLTKKKSITLEDFVEEPLIVREAGSGTRLAIENKLIEKGIAPDKLKIRLELGSTEAVINAVAAGLGISLVSRFAVKSRANAGEIAVLNVRELPLERGLYFITRRDQVISPLVEAFYNFLKDYLHPFIV
ncbi:MAG: selenium metabolism-associated LysR family transcriptional regulator [Syntrophaceticus sp.]